MKKVFVLFALCAVVYACNSSDNGPKKEETKTTEPAAGTSSAATDEKALEMIGSLDCTTCHHLTNKGIGPAYIEVSKKYENTETVVTDLAGKIIKGGQGVWGSVPMTPHPGLSEDDAKFMVRYILTLKDKK